MNESRLEKLAPLSGAITSALLIIGVFLINAFDYNPTAERAAEIFSQNSGRVVLGAILGSISGLTLIWFAGSVYSALHQAEGGTGRLSMIAFGGGVMSGMGLLAGYYTIIYTAGLLAGQTDGISPTQALIMFNLYIILTGLMHGMALLMGASAIVALRTKSFPAWFGWASVVITLGIVSPLDYIFLEASPLWIALVSVWLFARGMQRHTSVETPERPSVASTG